MNDTMHELPSVRDVRLFLFTVASVVAMLVIIGSASMVLSPA